MSPLDSVLARRHYPLVNEAVLVKIVTTRLENVNRDARGTTCTHRLIGHRSRDSLLDAARCNVGVTIDVPLEAQEV